MVRAVTADKVPVTAAAAAFGYSRPSYYQAAAALAGSGLEGLVPARPGPRRAHKLTGEILAWAEQQLAASPALRPARWPGRSRRTSACARTPGPSSERWPGTGSATPKAADLPARERGKEEHPSLSPPTSPGHAAAEPGNCPDAGQDTAPGGGRCPLRATASCRPARTRAGVPPRPWRAARGGVTTWRRALADLIPAGPPPAPARRRRPPAARHAPRPGRRSPAPVAAELIGILAALALAGAATTSPSP